MSSIQPIVRRICTGVFFFAASVLTSNLTANESNQSVEVADAVTYVSLAKVNLSVGTMSFDAGKLLGTYSIDVPLMQSKSEKGSIELKLPEGVEVYARDGGSISGEGVVTGNEELRRKIEVRFSPCNNETNEGEIELTIDTGLRILQFKSTYLLSSKGLAASD